MRWLQLRKWPVGGECERGECEHVERQAGTLLGTWESRRRLSAIRRMTSMGDRYRTGQAGTGQTRTGQTERVTMGSTTSIHALARHTREVLANIWITVYSPIAARSGVVLRPSSMTGEDG